MDLRSPRVIYITCSRDEEGPWPSYAVNGSDCTDTFRPPLGEALWMRPSNPAFQSAGQPCTGRRHFESIRCLRNRILLKECIYLFKQALKSIFCFA